MFTSEDVWAAWHSGQDVPARAWDDIARYATRTAEDVARLDLLARAQKYERFLEAEVKKHWLAIYRLSEDMEQARAAIATLRDAGPAWITAYRELSEAKSQGRPLLFSASRREK